MHRFNSCIAVITGAGSGIGRALAVELAGCGARLAISDIDANALTETHRLISSTANNTHKATLDVSNQNAVFNYADQVSRELGAANLVINNAGVGLNTGTLQATTVDEFEWLMGINFSGVLYGTKAFLPHMEKAEWGHIVNISSLFGLIGVPEQSAYNASKFAVRGLTEALRQELELSKSHISCTSVHPGGVKTNIARNARMGIATKAYDQALLSSINADKFDQLARTSAQSAALQILQAVVKNKRRVLIGKDAKLLDWVQRHFPNHYQRVLQWAINKASRE